MAMDPVEGVPRLTFGFSYLLGGIPMIPVMIGMFAVSEVLKQVIRPTQIKSDKVIDFKRSRKWLSFREWWDLKMTMLRCSVLGTISASSRAGATISSFLGYSMEMKFARHPEEFARGRSTAFPPARPRTMPPRAVPWFPSCLSEFLEAMQRR
jgi:putative tricarboxylic transport membrane protein